MKNKKWLLILIIAFPSFFWLVLETSTINSKKLPYYGPKKALGKKDTLFYAIKNKFYGINKNTGEISNSADTLPFPVYAIILINEKYRKDAYRLTGLWEYLSYKKLKIEHIPFVLVTQSDNSKSLAYDELRVMSKSKNVFFYTFPKTAFDSLTKVFFKEKPYYIDYSFFMLIDGGGHIRGYYDGRYVSELKRLIDEYQHLRLKEEKTKLTESNEIKSNS